MLLFQTIIPLYTQTHITSYYINITLVRELHTGSWYLDAFLTNMNAGKYHTLCNDRFVLILFGRFTIALNA